MAIKKSNGSYKCFFCDFTDANEVKVQNHQDKEHEYVTIPIQIEDLDRLIKFIYLKDDSLLNPKLITLFKYYLRRVVRRGRHTMESLTDE